MQSPSILDEHLGMAKAALATTKDLLSRYRFRLAGSLQCRLAAQEIASALHECCDRCHEEPFVLHPKALWWLGKMLAVIYTAATLLSLLGGIFLWIGSLLCLIGFVYGLAQYIFYSRLFDPLFRSAEGRNVVGTLEPANAADRRVVLVSHHDSPYIFSFLERLQPIAFARLSLGMLSYAWLTMYLIFLAIKQLLSGQAQHSRGALLWLVAIGALFALQLFLMMSRRPSPGAGDNLNSTSMNIEVAKHFTRCKDSDKQLQNTRLVVLSTDGEEIGQRGAIEYVRAHLPELRRMPTYVLNIDSVYYLQDLAVLTRDRHGRVKLSSSMVDTLLRIAKKYQINIRAKPIPFGGGGTDAAAFAVKGIETTGLIAQPTGLLRNDHLYHTSKDTAEMIDERAVSAIISIIIEYVRCVDAAK
jgi:aminopeptidase YwaD